MENNLNTAIERSIIFRLGEAEISKVRMQAVINHQGKEIDMLQAQLKAAQEEVKTLKAIVANLNDEPELPMNGEIHVNGGAKH
jgi:hypothetical protein